MLESEPAIPPISASTTVEIGVFLFRPEAQKLDEKTTCGRLSDFLSACAQPCVYVYLSVFACVCLRVCCVRMFVSACVNSCFRVQRDFAMDTSCSVPRDGIRSAMRVTDLHDHDCIHERKFGILAICAVFFSYRFSGCSIKVVMRYDVLVRVQF